MSKFITIVLIIASIIFFASFHATYNWASIDTQLYWETKDEK